MPRGCAIFTLSLAIDGGLGGTHTNVEGKTRENFKGDKVRPNMTQLTCVPAVDLWFYWLMDSNVYI